MKNKNLVKSVLIVIVVIIFFFILNNKKEKTEQVSENNVSNISSDNSSLPGTQTSTAPWIPEIGHLRERLTAIGLPALSSEGSALHIHQHLDIFIHGNLFSAPGGIGINGFAGFISPIHTHDESSVIHIESATVQDFNLGQFFDIWGVKFTKDSIGGYTSDAKNSLKVFVNGKEFVGDLRTLVLAAHQEIVITFGTSAELPKTIPETYTFTNGE